MDLLDMIMTIEDEEKRKDFLDAYDRLINDIDWLTCKPPKSGRYVVTWGDHVDTLYWNDELNKWTLVKGGTVVNNVVAWRKIVTPYKVKY